MSKGAALLKVYELLGWVKVKAKPEEKKSA